MAKITKTIAILFSALIFFSCANQLPPTGGVIDKIPPEIIEVSPANGTVNFDGNSVEITFSEYVDKRSVQNSVFISPAVEGEIEYDWSGKSLEIIFPSKLKANTTYTITIGTDVEDINNRNNMAQSFALNFSTGEKIDKNKISGKVYDDNPLGTYVFSYKVNADTIPALSRQKPDYISQVGKDGKFEISGLGKGKYFLTAVKDELRNYLYEAGEDAIGLPSQFYTFGENDTLISDINFFIDVVDTIPPSIVSVAMTDRNHFLVEFNENIDSTSISKANFEMIDSTSGKIIYPFALFKSRNKSAQFFLSVKDTLNSANRNFIAGKDISDKSGNKMLREVYEITLNEKADTSFAAVKSISTEFSDNKVDFSNPYFQINYDDGITFDASGNIFSIKEISGSEKNFNPIMTDDATMRLEYTGKLKPKSSYTLLINQKYFEDAAGNKADSSYTYKFLTNNELDYGGVSGNVQSESAEKINLELKNIAESKIIYKQSVDSSKTFNYRKIKPGKYLLWGYADKDSSDTYTKGKLKPFRYSEKFRYYSDTLNVRARWPIGDVTIKIR